MTGIDVSQTCESNHDIDIGQNGYSTHGAGLVSLSGHPAEQSPVAVVSAKTKV